MGNLIRTIKKLKKNKSGIEAAGMSLVVKIAITLIAAGLFFWMITSMIKRYV